MAIPLDCHYIIIGGGVAALATAIHLARAKQEVLLIEAGSYPSHKVCGEFLSPLAYALLSQLDLTPPISFQSMELIRNERSFPLLFSSNVGSWSRYQLDLTLADCARHAGAKICTQTKVEQINDTAVKLENGEQLRAKELIIATGRFAQKPKCFPYLGFKTHFRNVECQKLEMHVGKNAYVGMTPIGKGCVNVAGITTEKERILPQSLSNRLSDAEPLFDWMDVQVPSFGFHPTAKHPHTHFIGDAAMTIPPASGSGLALGLRSAQIASSQLLSGAGEAIPKIYAREFKKQILWAQLAQFALLHPLPIWQLAIPSLFKRVI